MNNRYATSKLCCYCIVLSSCLWIWIALECIFLPVIQLFSCNVIIVANIPIIVTRLTHEKANVELQFAVFRTTLSIHNFLLVRSLIYLLDEIVHVCYCAPCCVSVLITLNTEYWWCITDNTALKLATRPHLLPCYYSFLNFFYFCINAVMNLIRGLR